MALVIGRRVLGELRNVLMGSAVCFATDRSLDLL